MTAPAKKADARKRAAFEARMARLRRIRTLVGLAGFVPLAITLACPGLGPFCEVPREVYLGVWAAVLGSFIGLTIRLWRERREFERAAPAAA